MCSAGALANMGRLNAARSDVSLLGDTDISQLRFSTYNALVGLNMVTAFRMGRCGALGPVPARRWEAFFISTVSVGAGGTREFFTVTPTISLRRIHKNDNKEPWWRI